MVPDYTINDAFKDGFECGLLYILRYAETEAQCHISNEDLVRLSEHLETKKSWKSRDEWCKLLGG